MYSRYNMENTMVFTKAMQYKKYFIKEIIFEIIEKRGNK